MFEVVATGKNENYGQAGQKRLLADTLLLNAVKKNWVHPYVKYDGVGNGQLKIIPINDKCRLCGQVKP